MTNRIGKSLVQEAERKMELPGLQITASMFPQYFV